MCACVAIRCVMLRARASARRCACGVWRGAEKDGRGVNDDEEGERSLGTMIRPASPPSPAVRRAVQAEIASLETQVQRLRSLLKQLRRRHPHGDGNGDGEVELMASPLLVHSARTRVGAAPSATTQLARLRALATGRRWSMTGAWGGHGGGACNCRWGSRHA